MNDTTSDDDSLTQAVRFQRDLYLSWQTIERARGASLTTRGYLTRPAVRRLRARLATADGQPAPEGEVAEYEDSRLLFMRRLLQRLGLVRVAQGRLIVADADAMQRYLALPLGERVRLCLRAWVAGGWWPDRLDARAPLPGLMSPAPPRIALARRRLLDALAESGVELVAPRVVASPGTVSRSAHGTKDKHRLGVSPALDADTQTAAMRGPLAWMGIVSVSEPGARTDSGPTRHQVLFAAPGQGNAARLGTVSLERWGRVVVQPNLEVIAYPPLTAPALATLSTCADEAAFGHVCTFRLTRDAVGRAKVAGWSAAEVIRRLEGLADAPLPAAVAVRLRDWGRNVERIQLTPEAVLLEVDDVELLEQLMSDPAAAQWVERRLAPTAALLGRGSEASVRAWLLRRSAFPAIITQPDPA
jgi:hypothetical protein